MRVVPDQELLPIADVAAAVGLTPDELEPYGRHVAKVSLDALADRADEPDGKLIAVTAMTPTKGGEGKTTTAIALLEALGLLGERSLACLREPSLGPVFGSKGGGTGAGRARLAPADRIDLHLTGDIHAVGAATNLLAAMLESHLLHGNALGIDPRTITWRRCVDMDDRALRRVLVALGDAAPRETGFDITAASETMAVLAVAESRADLRRRLGAITVAHTPDGPVTADDLGAAGAMAALLHDALLPTLVQTVAGDPVLVHCGPFANIAHGNSSLLATRLGLKLGDYVVTESGFGADLGFEKLVDILRLAPAAVVLVATVQALRLHGEENLAAHLRLVRAFGLDPVVAINRFPGDTGADVADACAAARRVGARAVAASEGFERGGEGALALAEAVLEAAATPPEVRSLYALDDPLADKLDAVARRAYGAAGVALAPAARAEAERLEAAGLGALPVCVAKTHLSLSHDPALAGAPHGFVLPVRELRAYTGAGWVVALTGDVQTMPGLPADPAATRIDVEPAGTIVGLR